MKCPKGHTYRNSLTECPVCRKKSSLIGDTAVIAGEGNNGNTEIFPEFNNDDDNKTVLIGNTSNPSQTINRKINPTSSSNGTMYGGEFDSDVESGNSNEEKEELRTQRKLVGWLITYSMDPLGIDYRLYEGRNEIGHDINCHITVNDGTMSGKHATIRFRTGKYKIKDEFSAHGTFVNDEDIEEETIELHDGDLIRMGKTVFEFKAPASL
ncbi:peptide-binding protein [Bacteroidia bacterium]|nr:peptide-binding protein [Bacteroidia bacterium]